MPNVLTILCNVTIFKYVDWELSDFREERIDKNTFENDMVIC